MHSATPREVGQLPYTLFARRNLRLTLTNRQAEILIGSILGDGYIHPLGKIQIEHSEKQNEYIKWKLKELNNLSYKKLSTVKRADKRNNKTYYSRRFWLRQYFRSWREYFYQGKEKIFPENLRLKPLILAVWYMDDGSYSNKRCILSTDSFNLSSLQRIIKELKRLKVDAYIRSNKKIGIRQKDQKRFFTLIEPYIHKDMKYKLP